MFNINEKYINSGRIVLTIGRIEHLQLFELFKHASETLFNLTLDGMQILVICEFFKSDDN